MSAEWKHGICGCSHDLGICKYSSNSITKKEPKTDAHLSEFIWHNLCISIFLSIMLLYNLLNSILGTNKTLFASHSSMQ